MRLYVAEHHRVEPSLVALECPYDAPDHDRTPGCDELSAGSVEIMGHFVVFSVDGVILMTTLVVAVLVIRASRSTLKSTPVDHSATHKSVEFKIESPTLLVSKPGETDLQPISTMLMLREPVEIPHLLASVASSPESPQTHFEQSSADHAQTSGLFRQLKRRIDKLTANPWRSIPLASACLTLGLVLSYKGQSQLLENRIPAGSYLIWFLGLGLITALAWAAPSFAMAVEQSTREDQFPIFPSGPRIFAAGFALVASVLIWINGRDRLVTDPSWDLVILWLASIGALFVVAFDLPRKSTPGLMLNKIRAARLDLLLGFAVVLAALLPRLYDLTGNPWAMSGDEGTFAVTARDAIDGKIRNPFYSGPWGYPSLLFMIQGWLMELYGVNVGGARFMSAMLGVGSVLSIYLLTRHHFGRVTALFAAAFGSSFHFHLFWSRNAQNAAAPMLFVPLTLLFLDRGLIGRRRADSLFAGCIIGFAQFFHPGDRIIFPIAAAYACYALVYPGIRSWSKLKTSAAALLPQIAWVTIGAVVTHLPLLAYFSTHRMAFSDRTNQVSVFASGWLDREVEVTGKSAAQILLIQFKNAAMLPFNTQPGGHFHNDPPFVGWPLVLPVAIGMAFVTLYFWQRRTVGLAIGFWAVVAGLALTDGMPQTNRYTTAAPFLVIFAAIGITLISGILVRLIRLHRIPVTTFATAIVILIAYWNLDFTFSEPNRFRVTSDTNTQIANQLARETEALGPGATVYFSGMPRLSYHGFANIGYIAPDAQGIDIGENERWTSESSKPILTGPTLFAFIPARIEELDVIEQWFPVGVRSEYTLPNGEPTYVSYLVEP